MKKYSSTVRSRVPLDERNSQLRGEGKADIRVYLLDELLFYFAIIENQGARRLSIILRGARPLSREEQSDFKNFRVSFATS